MLNKMEIVASFPLEESGTSTGQRWDANSVIVRNNLQIFLIHFQKYSGFLLIAALGLFQVGVHMKATEGVLVKFPRLWIILLMISNKDAV